MVQTPPNGCEMLKKGSFLVFMVSKAKNLEKKLITERGNFPKMGNFLCTSRLGSMGWIMKAKLSKVILATPSSGPKQFPLLVHYFLLRGDKAIYVPVRESHDGHYLHRVRFWR